ncbi:MAG: CCA tRNA nucleotidyltransferase [Hyphomicrobiales bacterium]
MEPHLVNRSWLDEPALKTLLTVLNAEGEETRIIGGAVRDALLGEEIGDIDCATTATPDKVTKMAEASGFKVVPTGIDHGTVTVIVESKPFEVTTLREDIKTDGRHAIVEFGRDWVKDAERRDFTMNALSIDINGDVHDPIGGYADLVHREIRFIGDAEIRITEDYLRALRFFRFFAWYGAGRPNRDGMRAVVRTKAGLEGLSVERVWSELKKILRARDPERAILWMRTTEVLNVILSENWGLDQFHWMLAAERDQDWEIDPMRRLQAMLRPADDVVHGVADRLKLSNAERAQLVDWTQESALAKTYVDLSDSEFSKVLYRGKPSAIVDALAHEYAKRLTKEEEGAERILALIAVAGSWTRPQLPVAGADLKKKGMAAGPEIGAKLAELETLWIESDFTLTKKALLDLL